MQSVLMPVLVGSGYSELRIGSRKNSLSMASKYVRILCGAQCYWHFQHFTLVQQIIAWLHAKRRSFWRVPCIRNALYGEGCEHVRWKLSACLVYRSAGTRDDNMVKPSSGLPRQWLEETHVVRERQFVDGSGTNGCPFCDARTCVHWWVTVCWRRFTMSSLWTPVGFPLAIIRPCVTHQIKACCYYGLCYQNSYVMVCNAHI